MLIYITFHVTLLWCLRYFHLLLLTSELTGMIHCVPKLHTVAVNVTYRTQIE